MFNMPFPTASLLSTVEAVSNLKIQHQIRDSSNPDLAVDSAMLNLQASQALVQANKLPCKHTNVVSSEYFSADLSS